MIEFDGFIRNISYSPQFRKKVLKTYSFEEFDVNSCSSNGYIQLGKNNNIAYSTWVTPKRTRSFPFARLFDIYETNSKIITIIPIIKDEGGDSGNNDRINAITFSWMNLLNVYIILAYYTDAKKQSPEKRKEAKNKTSKMTNLKTEYITKQILDNSYIKQKITEISQYKMSALHWNTKHFQDDFQNIWNLSLQNYRRISQEQNVRLHNFDLHEQALRSYLKNDKFDIDSFKEETNIKSKEAQGREIQTTHILESLGNGQKAKFNLENYLGGIYYLTCDEVFIENGKLIIQESKNSSKKIFPSDNDIKDGLFKLILFANIEKLKIANEEIKFTTRLKLTGKIEGDLYLPASIQDIQPFISRNKLEKQKTTIIALNQHAITNEITIHISKATEINNPEEGEEEENEEEDEEKNDEVRKDGKIRNLDLFLKKKTP